MQLVWVISIKTFNKNTIQFTHALGVAQSFRNGTNFGRYRCIIVDINRMQNESNVKSFKLTHRNKDEISSIDALTRVKTVWLQCKALSVSKDTDVFTLIRLSTIEASFRNVIFDYGMNKKKKQRRQKAGRRRDKKEVVNTSDWSDEHFAMLTATMKHNLMFVQIVFTCKFP